jgi:protocatechuate 3,4-dioxygenase beta subunit
LIGRLWQESKTPQVVVRDKDGRLGWIYLIYSGVRDLPTTVKLRDGTAVRGRVIGEDGRPAAGARLVAREFEQARTGQNFAEMVRLPPEVTDHYRAETNAEGMFILRDVPSGARMIADVEAAGFARLTLDWDTATPLELRLPRPAAVVGRLIGGADADRAGHSLTLETADSPRRQTTRGPVVVSVSQTIPAGSDGTFRFEAVPPGKYTLRPAERKVGPLYLESRPIEVNAGAEVTGLDWPLKPARKLRGQVVDAKTGAGVAGATVALSRFRDQGGPFGRQWMGADTEAVSGPDGWYQGYVIPDRIVGAKLTKMPDGYSRDDAGEVQADADPTAPLPPLRIEKAEPLVVQVVDADGKPVAGAKVEVTGPAAYMASGPPKPTGPDGKSLLALTDRGENIGVRATAGDAVSEIVAVNPAEQREPIAVTVSPANAFYLRGQVVDRAARPVADAAVSFMRMVMFRSKRQGGWPDSVSPTPPPAPTSTAASPSARLCPATGTTPASVLTATSRPARAMSPRSRARRTTSAGSSWRAWTASSAGGWRTPPAGRLPGFASSTAATPRSRSALPPVPTANSS